MSPRSDERTPGSGGDPAAIAGLFRQLPAPEAREALVKEFLPLAEHLARRFSGRGEPIEDLSQVASLALLHAIDRFDPDREVQFSTFASVTILGELKRHFRDRGWAIRVPRNLKESAMLVNDVLRQLWQELGRSPTIGEIAKKAGLSEDQVLEAMDAVQAYSTASLDASTGDDGGSVSEAVGTVDERYEISDEWLSVAPAMRRLPEREREILYLRFFKGLTQSEIAERIGISQMHASRLLAQTLERLRKESEAESKRET
ncbi:MAG: SigB/SigF/SigG family RNA polymerase sigma factor [Actinomycetota bacterium]|nr:SigB/SigF/SigG family RNA polymerase sigma factor [Actinomycetota bacterium]